MLLCYVYWRLSLLFYLFVFSFFVHCLAPMQILSLFLMNLWICIRNAVYSSVDLPAGLPNQLEESTCPIEGSTAQLVGGGSTAQLDDGGGTIGQAGPELTNIVVKISWKILVSSLKTFYVNHKIKNLFYNH